MQRLREALQEYQGLWEEESLQDEWLGRVDAFDTGCRESEDSPLLGRWLLTDGGGGWVGFRELSFTRARIYADDPQGGMLHFKVRCYSWNAETVRVRTEFGETFAFEQQSPDTICLPRPRARKLQKGATADGTEPLHRRCWQRVAPELPLHEGV